MGKALVLVGHGSARNPNTRLPLCHVVQEIKRRGTYDEVRCGLLKEEPRVCKTLQPLTSTDITIVPFFISDGYYTRNVIPECLCLKKGHPDRNIRYTNAIGSHPAFAGLILRHARDVGWTPGDALVVLGHGTPKNPASGINVYLQAERVRAAMPGEDVLTTFIDEAPFVTDVWSLTEAQRTFIVPLFVGNGWHVTETIPEDLGLDDSFKGLRDGRELIMTSAVGTDPGLVDVILEIAGEAEEEEKSQREHGDH
jgi:sirohydrochlorin cobaltochelatase